MTGDWFEREEQPQPSGRVYIRLRCKDCTGEVRLVKSEAGEKRAALMVAEHKPSGCCDDRTKGV
jgi:hypothetical protein